ncbi:CDKN2A-interacting protein isoform X1 [Bufo gargarizans]|uniref:CDKN2A-interacting protein isoform X1 n=1 Tax=Bufo gargarizans TaxID=30331 RepID=UPI001CF10D0E|nr:CDKN2A-interacting protein isoform X1 [Bufo gargarizans]
MGMASGEDVSEYLRQNRETAAWVESVRGECESDKVWRHRREFILRNMSDFCEDEQQPPPPESGHRGLDRLLSYSMVWVNHVFTGCRYPPPVMDRVLKMAENIKVTDAPVHTTRDELVSKVKKRGIASSNEGVEDEPSKKQRSTDEAWRQSEADSQQSSNASAEDGRHNEAQKTGSGYNEPAAQEWKSNSRPATKVQAQANTGKSTRRLTSEDVKCRQPFFNRLYKRVAWKLVSSGGFSLSLNHTEVLSSSVESLSSTLDIAFVPLKDLADLPQNKTTQENVVCELRCQGVYLGMGCGKTKENAKAVASREAIKVFLKKKVVVKICKRKYCGQDVEDLALLDEESRCQNLPPAVKNPREVI